MPREVVCTHCRTPMQYQSTGSKGLLPAELLCYAIGTVLGIIGFLTSGFFFGILGIGACVVGWSLRSAADKKGWVCPNCGYHFNAVQ